MEKQNKPITHLSWGKMQVNIQGKVYEFKDCKIWPEGAVKWDWNLTGTKHDTGIQPGDIKDILEHDIEVMVLSRGFDMKMKVSPATEELLKSLGIEYYIHDTQKAVELFNSLFQQGKRAGGIFHSTC
ncbi:MAG: Mth938-like domain-containing protein [Deltaproteobacteria bacterium]|nr:Mth938-like domain-containing protein [Deltaproteobacteria bacterium]